MSSPSYGHCSTTNKLWANIWGSAGTSLAHKQGDRLFSKRGILNLKKGFPKRGELGLPNLTQMCVGVCVCVCVHEFGLYIGFMELLLK